MLGSGDRTALGIFPSSRGCRSWIANRGGRTRGLCRGNFASFFHGPPPNEPWQSGASVPIGCPSIGVMGHGPILALRGRCPSITWKIQRCLKHRVLSPTPSHPSVRRPFEPELCLSCVGQPGGRGDACPGIRIGENGTDGMDLRFGSRQVQTPSRGRSWLEGRQSRCTPRGTLAERSGGVSEHEYRVGAGQLESFVRKRELDATRVITLARVEVLLGRPSSKRDNKERVWIPRDSQGRLQGSNPQPTWSHGTTMGPAVQ